MRTPPRLAHFLLRRCAGSYQREALIGDLLEEHARGRSGAWFWWQVICVAGSTTQQALRAHLHGIMVVAAWWGILSFLTFALNLPLILLALDPSIYGWLKRRRRRREAAHRAVLLMLFVCLCLPYGLPRPADAAQQADRQSETRLLHALPSKHYHKPAPRALDVARPAGPAASPTP